MQLIIDTPNKELNKAIKDKVRDELRSTPQSNTRGYGEHPITGRKT